MRALSPKRVAQALGVSESSLKRWCDQGLIPSEKTAGGHRRLSVESVVRFVQQQKRALVRPELLGLPAGTCCDARSAAEMRQALMESLARGDDECSRQVVISMFLSGTRISEIVDDLITPVFVQIGEQWDCHELDIYQERRSCEICLRLLYELGKLVPAPPATAPQAIGGTIECDAYSLPTTAVEIVFRENNWRARSLGSRLPFDSMVTAIRDTRPDVFWISVSHVVDEEMFVRQYNEFYEEIQDEVPIVVGGRAITDRIRSQIKFATCCDRLQHLESFIRAQRRVSVA